jgi:hypothetical protein
MQDGIVFSENKWKHRNLPGYIFGMLLALLLNEGISKEGMDNGSQTKSN